MDNNSKSSQHSVKLGAFGRDVSEAVEEIINHAYEDIASLVCAELTIPKGYVKLPDEAETVTKKPDTIQEKLCTALAAAIPAATAATGAPTTYRAEKVDAVVEKLLRVIFERARSTRFKSRQPSRRSWQGRSGKATSGCCPGRICLTPFP